MFTLNSSPVYFIKQNKETGGYYKHFVNIYSSNSSSNSSKCLFLNIKLLIVSSVNLIFLYKFYYI